MTNLDTSVIGTRCISYYASSKSVIDGKQSFEFWIRGKCIRIVANKPFARGDVLQIDAIKETSFGILIETTLIDEWQEGYPVLNFVSGRLIYNKWAEFECTPSEGIQILKTVEQVLSENYSIGFIILAYQSGKISCCDNKTGNRFDIQLNLNWE